MRLTRPITTTTFQLARALLRIELEDVNEFRPEFERSQYAVSIDVGRLGASRPDGAEPHELEDADDEAAGRKSAAATGWCHLLTVRAHDQDCSRRFGQVCQYELIELNAAPSAPGGDSTPTANFDQQEAAGGAPQQQQQQHRAGLAIGEFVRVDQRGNVRAHCAWLRAQAARQQHWPNGSVGAPVVLAFQVVAFDCGGKKSQTPANVQVELLARPQQEGGRLSKGVQAAHCQPGWKGKWHRRPSGLPVARAHFGTRERPIGAKRPTIGGGRNLCACP
jgi:hypothetical protein